MQKDLKIQLAIPVILTVIFIASSFLPICQIFILTLDGGLIALVNKSFGSDNTGNYLTENIIVNFLPTIFFLFLFFNTTKQSIKIISATFSIIFMISFIFFLPNILNKDSNPYFLKFMLVSLISGLPVILVAILKYGQVKKYQDRF